MEEAHALLARLERIEALDREGAPPALLLPELQALVHEAEAAAAACACACEAVMGDAIVPA